MRVSPFLLTNCNCILQYRVSRYPTDHDDEDDREADSQALLDSEYEAQDQANDDVNAEPESEQQIEAPSTPKITEFIATPSSPYPMPVSADPSVPDAATGSVSHTPISPSPSSPIIKPTTSLASTGTSPATSSRALSPAADAVHHLMPHVPRSSLKASTRSLFTPLTDSTPSPASPAVPEDAYLKDSRVEVARSVDEDIIIAPSESTEPSISVEAKVSEHLISDAEDVYPTEEPTNPSLGGLSYSEGTDDGAVLVDSENSTSSVTVVTQEASEANAPVDTIKSLSYEVADEKKDVNGDTSEGAAAIVDTDVTHADASTAREVLEADEAESDGVDEATQVDETTQVDELAQEPNADHASAAALGESVSEETIVPSEVL